jgi:predicted amidohydrolase
MDETRRYIALQLPLLWNEKERAFALLEEHLSRLSQSSQPTVVLLPEAFLTGYVSPFGGFDLRPFAEPLLADSHQKLRALAQRFQVALAAPLIEKDGKKFFNSMLFIDETGATLAHYRKRHPWFPERWATAGNLGMPVFSWRGISVTMAICFDLHFLEGECARELQEADLLLFSSVWVEEEKDTRTPQLQHLAKKFSLHVVNANWARSNPYVPSQGGSVIISNTGDILARADDSPQMTISVW